MRVVLQRAARAEVRIDGRVVGAIGRGCLLLAGFTSRDTEAEVRWMVDKILSLRLFPDPDGAEDRAAGSPARSSSFSRTLADVGGGVLVVSQFTLYGSVRKGTRPSFTDAAPPEVAIPLYKRFVALLRDQSPGPVETGEFGAMMEIDFVNDGPVTLVLER
jgi:D-aminoacyl-tRNA deacylase